MSRQASLSPLLESIIPDTIVVRTGDHGIVPAARRLEKLDVIHSSREENCSVEETDSEDDTSTDGSISPVNKSLIVTLKVGQQKMAEVLNNTPKASAANDSENASVQTARERDLFEMRFRSKWRNLQFKIRRIARSVVEDGLDIKFADLPQSKSIHLSIKKEDMEDKTLKQIQYGSYIIETRLWRDVTDFIFRSIGGNNLLKARRSLKMMRNCTLKASRSSSDISALWTWFIQGWTLLEPLSKDIAREMNQKDCPFVDWVSCQMKQGHRQLRIDDDLRDMFTLAVEVDDMVMRCHSLITIGWPNAREFEEDRMDPVYVDHEALHSPEVRMQVTPVVLRSEIGNSEDRNRSIVIIKGDVVLG